MLPSIYKSTSGLPNDRFGSGVNATYLADTNKKSTTLGLPSPGRSGYSEPRNDMVAGAMSNRLTERVLALERDNAHFREQLAHLRQVYSSNQTQHENEKLSVTSQFEDLQRLTQSFNSKLQADLHRQQREQQKAALLFAEVARLGHRLEGLEDEVKSVVENVYRKIEAQDQHVQFLTSFASKQQSQPAVSPGRNSELQRQLRDTQDAVVQLRNELDADRNARWKNDAAVDAKLDAQIERLTSKLTADKRDLAHVLDEQRQLMTGADFQRVTAHMREFSRVNDHLLALERWLLSEFGQVKRIFQAMAGGVDARFQFVLVELANGLKAWHAALARLEDDLGGRIQDLEDATRAVTLTVQRNVHALEEVLPLEVQARQKNDDKLRRRMESVVKALGHAIETSREEFLSHQVTLVHRVHRLEHDHRHKNSEQVENQHKAMRETIQTFVNDSDAMLARLADTIEQERAKGFQVVAERTVASHVPTLVSPPPLHVASDDIRSDSKRVKEELDALQLWTAKHTQECRQFFDFLNWSMDDTRREMAVMQCLRDVIDQVVEMQAFKKICAVERSVSGALRKIEQVSCTTSRVAPNTMALPTVFDQEIYRIQTNLNASCKHSEKAHGAQLVYGDAGSQKEAIMPFLSSSLPDEGDVEAGSQAMAVDQMNLLLAAVETEEKVLLGETPSNAPSCEAAADENDEADKDGCTSMDTTEYSVDFEQIPSARARLHVPQAEIQEGCDDYDDDSDYTEKTKDSLRSLLEPALHPVNDNLDQEEPSTLNL